MRLAQFIRKNIDEIIQQSVAHALDIPVLAGQANNVLRDHLPLVLEAFIVDMEQPQTREESISKSLGNGPRAATETAAQTHGTLRARVGLDISELVAEYRVLRSTVQRLWLDSQELSKDMLEDLLRFNEAVDQAVAESVIFYSAEVDRWRDIFLGVLGHDLRGPLNGMLLTAELLRSTQHSPELVSSLTRNGRRLTALIDSLLEYNKSTLGVGMQLHREPVDLAVECHDELEVLRRAFPRRQIEWRVVGDLTGVFDASRVREALYNLVSNAVQHSPQDTSVQVRGIGNDATVEISTENFSPPISADVLATLFDPLRRSAGETGVAGSHLGLGLFIVREIASAHQGTIAGKSGDGVIEFCMSLPKRPSDRAVSARANSHIEPSENVKSH